ncbi:hypothetical protein U1Q18_051841, partial [Sarracenia purpurea var. burkii]
AVALSIRVNTKYTVRVVSIATAEEQEAKRRAMCIVRWPSASCCDTVQADGEADQQS